MSKKIPGDLKVTLRDTEQGRVLDITINGIYTATLVGSGMTYFFDQVARLRIRASEVSGG